ncbi:MAG: response regulator [Saprospiraceae bacterium]
MSDLTKSVKTILIIDDDADDRELFREALLQVAPRVEYMEADDGDVALLMLTQPDAVLPDVIFLDLNMPRMNGKQCLIELKKAIGLADVPVIIYTTSKREADIEETRSLGAVYFITKPAAFDNICKSIGSALTEPWKHAESMV